MVTRGRPKRASAALEIAQSLASGKHQLEFIVCCDDDDYQTQEKLKNYNLSIAPAPLELGELWNRGAVLIPDADVFCPFIDDSFIAAPDWDEIIVQRLSEQRVKLVGWNDQANPGLMTLPIVGAEWYKVAGLYPGWFPYWFYDTWVAEVYSFVTGEPPFLPQELLLVGKKGETQRLRDVAFWWKFFALLRGERLAKAEIIRHKLNLAISDANLAHAVNYWQRRDEWFLARATELESKMTGESMQSKRYAMVKKSAEAKMIEFGAVK